MAREAKQATAQEVRDWARDAGYDVGERGRFSTDIVNGFNAAHRRNNKFYPGGTGEPQSGNARAATTTTRTARSSSDTRQTRQRPTSGTTKTEAAPAPRQRRQTAEGGVVGALITSPGMGLDEKQMEQYNRMLADANAVTGQPMELTIVRLTPAAVA